MLLAYGAIKDILTYLTTHALRSSLEVALYKCTITINVSTHLLDASIKKIASMRKIHLTKNLWIEA
jgi:hypothetical protein